MSYIIRIVAPPPPPPHPPTISLHFDWLWKLICLGYFPALIFVFSLDKIRFDIQTWRLASALQHVSPDVTGREFRLTNTAIHYRGFARFASIQQSEFIWPGPFRLDAARQHSFQRHKPPPPPPPPPSTSASRDYRSRWRRQQVSTNQSDGSFPNFQSISSTILWPFDGARSEAVSRGGGKGEGGGGFIHPIICLLKLSNSDRISQLAV